ncbi:ABC-type uncharacterized transport system, permease component [Gynuella sunshinyii YC6258]|uniref:ABC-type uncharacterized transport system, permease component n=1 Tax=Gynuella sunshinyii YC6258 TaxID=1445510 RepID=A0A0C5VI07_9GAMM|nr:ABC-type uncharacterized transport system, permease component [Gynuella sunshinyii YC6258]
MNNSHLRWFPRLTLAAFLLPLGFGLFATWLPAVGYLPAIGAHQLSLNPWQQVFNHPSAASALWLTLKTGLLSAILATLLSLLLLMLLYDTRFWRIIQWLLAPVLAFPHVAFAAGLALLIAPSGWLMRWISPGLSGFETPPDWLLVKDPAGFSLILTLTLKELPFLLLMSLSAVHQLAIRQSLTVARSLGYDQYQSWLKILLPQLWPQLRLPALAVLVYSLSTVELALVTGPTTPPTFAVLIHRWFNDPDLQQRLTASAAATLLLLICALAVIVVLVMEKLMQRCCRGWLINGRRSSYLKILRPLAAPVAAGLLIITGLNLLVTILWSVTRRWRFPDALPSQWSGRYWLASLEQLQQPFWNTLLAGMGSVLIAIVLVVGCLEYEQVLKRRNARFDPSRTLWLLYLPLLIPQIAFVFGLQTLLLTLHLEASRISLIGAHLIFVLPYTFLTLAGPYRAFDERYQTLAIALCRSRWRAFWQVKRALLTRPLLLTMSVGFAVSVAQYLVTVYVGAGRIPTITTEAVSLASGSDRRVASVYVLWQLLIPLAGYTLALCWPAYGNRHS